MKKKESSLEVQIIEIEKIIPYSFNNRKHSDQQIDLIANSIREFGFNQPIVVDEDNIILVGHGRLKAAKKLGLTHVPHVKISNLDETKKKAYRILDNKIQNDSTWDFESLNIELPALEADGFDLEAWGLNDLLLEAQPEIEVRDDEFEPTEQTETYIKLGDLIELGRHRVLCGDSTANDDLARLMNGSLADLLITDPPYGVSYGEKNAFLNTISPANRIQESIKNDSKSPVEMNILWQKAFEQAFLSTKENASYYIFGPQGGDLMMMMMSIKDAKWQLKHMLVWVKNNHVLGRCDYHYKHEPIWFGWKEKQTHNFYGDSSQFSVWEFNKPNKSELHPTMKPVGLIAIAIKNSTKMDDVVLDLFLGSGTTLIAAEQLNRICYGMELEPKYCQVIIERYKKYCDDNNKKFECKINGKQFDFSSLSDL